ncbi:uncharacterized protein LOC132261268 [Phlebotomus argentipes]|uniref:uncharacterized protein LOC132261268 n=1 Tax=Phlebotomus argentipes TaxID=94469 RepID=UPI002892C4F6|nr:uncharacterized protein LOC132261268 [Phlebotomus argentipes]
MRQSLHQIIRPVLALVILMALLSGTVGVRKSRVSRRLEACCYYVVHGQYPDYITYYTPEELDQYKLWNESDEDILNVCNLDENGDIQISRPFGTENHEENAANDATTPGAEQPSHEIDEKSQVYVKNSTPNHVTLKPNIVPEESHKMGSVESCKLVKQVTFSVNFYVSVNPHTGSIEIMHVKSDMKR